MTRQNILKPRCDYANHDICEGQLYRLIGSEIILCHRHIVLRDLWCVAPLCDYVDFLDNLDGDTAQEMYDLHREAVPLDYWEEI